MGRRISPANRQHVIAFWREQLAPLANHRPVTASALVKAIRAAWRNPGINTRLVHAAAARLEAALADTSADRAAAIDAWTATAFIDTGGDLLISSGRRDDVLARIRDQGRRSREAARPEKRVTIQIGETEHKALRSLVKSGEYGSVEAAVAGVLQAYRRGRGNGKKGKPAKGVFTEPLLLNFHPEAKQTPANGPKEAV